MAWKPANTMNWDFLFHETGSPTESSVTHLEGMTYSLMTLGWGTEHVDGWPFLSPALCVGGCVSLGICLQIACVWVCSRLCGDFDNGYCAPKRGNLSSPVPPAVVSEAVYMWGWGGSPLHQPSPVVLRSMFWPLSDFPISLPWLRTPMERRAINFLGSRIPQHLHFLSCTLLMVTCNFKIFLSFKIIFVLRNDPTKDGKLHQI